MATELTHPDERPMSSYYDEHEGIFKKKLDEADVDLQHIMKRMASSKRAMEKAQGTDDYIRYALSYDMVNLEYRNAWLTRQQVILHHNNHIAESMLKENEAMMRELVNIVIDFSHRLDIAETAIKGIAKRPTSLLEANPIIQAYHQGVMKERARKAKEQAPTTNQSPQS